MLVSRIIAKELKKNNIKDIFMLTGYGSMYLNDAIEKEKINFYASRNEAAAPMMAEAYAKARNSLGAVCVTAGPGATNALPGLAEAFVDSAPVIIISGQVEKKNSADNYKNLNLRTLGTAEFSITRVLPNITKYCKTIKDPYFCLYEIQKAINIAKSGRPGPVWIEVPLDIQSFNIKNLKKLKKFKSLPNKKINLKNKFETLYKYIDNSSKPLFVVGNGIKQSKTEKKFKKILNKYKIPFLSSRFANDIFPYSNNLNMGLCGIKGTIFSKDITDKSDLIVSLGCRMAPTFLHGDPKNFAPKARIVSVDIDKNELNKDIRKIDLKINSSLDHFLNGFEKFVQKKKIKNFKKWVRECQKIKKLNQIPNITKSSKPIDLYYFMYHLCKNSRMNSYLITDAGSNYYVGGQAWFFEKNQKEISSTTNAAMGLSIPLSVGAAVAKPNNQIISVTGDGSLELNVQELKTISHYNLNIKTFVINNGGYASMIKWQDDYFKGNRLDTEDKTGVGTMNFKAIAKAFNLNYDLIYDPNNMNKQIKKILNSNTPCLVEVVTDPKQKIIGIDF